MDKKENIVHNVLWLRKAVHTFFQLSSPTKYVANSFVQTLTDEF